MTLDRYGHLLPSLDASLADALDATHAAVTATAPGENLLSLGRKRG